MNLNLNLNDKAQVLEYNKMCVEFLLPKNDFDVYYLPQFGRYESNYGAITYYDSFSINDLKFHSDWNWIMELVEAIESFNSSMTLFIIEDERCHVDSQLGWHIDVGTSSKKEAVVQAIYNFLKWYNSNK